MKLPPFATIFPSFEAKEGPGCEAGDAVLVVAVVVGAVAVGAGAVAGVVLGVVRGGAAASAGGAGFAPDSSVNAPRLGRGETRRPVTKYVKS